MQQQAWDMVEKRYRPKFRKKNQKKVSGSKFRSVLHMLEYKDRVKQVKHG